MCLNKWILTVAFTIFGVTAIDVKSTTACVVKVELLDRMIHVVNKDELCSCLMYEKATSADKTSEPCNLNISNSGGNLIIRADSMCECAGYVTNITRKYTTESDIIHHVIITTASTIPDGMPIKGDRKETVTDLHLYTTIEDKSKDTIFWSNSSVTKIFDLKFTTNETAETIKAETNFSKSLDTEYSTTTEIPFVYYLRNSSTALGSSTTEKNNESKSTRELNKSTTFHFSYFGKNATTDRTFDISSPIVIFTDGTKKDNFNATNGTTNDIVSHKDIIKNTTITTDKTESTTVTKAHLLDVIMHLHASNITNVTELIKNISSVSTSHMTDLVSPEVTNSKVGSSTTLTTKEIHPLYKENISRTFEVAGTSESLSSIYKDYFTDKFSTTPTETKATLFDLEFKKVIPISTTNRNKDTTNTNNSSTITPNVTEELTVSTTAEVIYDRNSTGSDGGTKIKTTKVDGVKAGVVATTTPTLNTSPSTVQSTTNNSSYSESVPIKGDAISYTNISLIAILTIICVVLIILLIVKIINSCLRKGSYVLPHESDRNIEMDVKK